MPSPQLDEEEFRKRFLSSFQDPAFDLLEAELGRYIGYWRPYATSHEELDKDQSVQEEVRNAARTLLRAVQEQRSGKLIDAGEGLSPVRQK
jgi:hypothetical protein